MYLWNLQHSSRPVYSEVRPTVFSIEPAWGGMGPNAWCLRWSRMRFFKGGRALSMASAASSAHTHTGSGWDKGTETSLLLSVVRRTSLWGHRMEQDVYGGFRKAFTPTLHSGMEEGIHIPQLLYWFHVWGRGGLKGASPMKPCFSGTCFCITVDRVAAGTKHAYKDVKSLWTQRNLFPNECTPNQAFLAGILQ